MLHRGVGEQTQQRHSHTIQSLSIENGCCVPTDGKVDARTLPVCSTFTIVTLKLWKPSIILTTAQPTGVCCLPLNIIDFILNAATPPVMRCVCTFVT